MIEDDEMTEDEKEKKVLGHLCSGLQKHFAASTYECIPSFNEDGELSGCDDTNPTVIKYCPYCGVRL